MIFSRREYCLAALGTSAIPIGYWAARPDEAIGGGAEQGDFGDYHSTLIDGRTPEYISWNGRKWRCAMGSTWNTGMEHCLRLNRSRARFEIRSSPVNRGPGDPPEKRRSEIRHPHSPRLPNGVPLWGAMSFRHHRWTDPAGMAQLRGAGVHGQLHIGSSFGGSPAVAFRRTRRGEFAITTRGENARKNTMRYRAPLAFDEVHHLVYRVVLHPVDGSLIVWLNGEKILDIANSSIGSSEADCYWGFGCYFAGGVTCPVIAEFGDVIYPGPADLRHRISFRPRWG